MLSQDKMIVRSAVYNIYQMIYSQEDKRLVDQYKQTNVALRKQLGNLNNEIDRILIKRSSKIGLQKLPTVSKHITDPNILQHQIQNLRKRSQLLQRDAELYKSKASVNYYKEVKQLEGQLQEKDAQMQECKKLIKQYERKDKIANVQATKQPKVDKKISYLQEQIGRYQKLEKDLIRQISSQQANEHKTINYIQQLTAKHGQATIKKQLQKQTLSPPKTIELKPRASIDEQQWVKLKKQFLIFKESKQNEEFALNEENQRVRAQIKEWEKKIKQKKRKIDAALQIQQKSRQSRVYSTLNPPAKQSMAYRYRDRSNSIQYNTKQ